ncbi:hypothetical protein AAVH_16519 [Aphelenchoides avenae]|nr:hypothetical protein AAVH_16519 [Aphelenchus avenae]
MPARLGDFIDKDEIGLVAIVLDISFVLTTILIPVPVYLIVKVKTIGKYRWYMLNGLIWDYVYDATLTLMKPVMCFPFIGGYVSGPLPVIGNSSDFALSCAFVFVALAMNLIGSACLSLVYRFAQVYPGRFHHFFEHSTCTYLLYVMVHLFFHASFIGGLLSVIKSSSARPLEAVASFADVHTFAYNYGFYAVERSAGIEAICWACGGTLVVFFVTGLGLTAALIRRARQFPTSSAYRLQMMLVRAFVAQLLIGCVCGLWPIVVVAFLLASNSRASGTGMNVFLVLSSFHGTLDTLAILYFVKPYRRAVLRAFLQIRFRFYGYMIRTTSPAASAWN